MNVHRGIRLVGLIALLGIPSPAFTQEAPADLPPEAQQAVQKAAQWDSYKASFNLEAKEEDGRTFLLNGTLQFQKPSKRRLEIQEGDNKESRQLLVSDGNVEWQYYPQGAMVYRVNQPPEPPGPHRPFSEAKPETLRFVERTQEEGEELLRFEGEPKPSTVEGAPVTVTKIALAVSEKDGLLREMALLDDKGQPLLTHRYRHIEVNVKIPEDQFAFTPPEGVAVMELPPAQEAVQERLGGGAVGQKQ